MYSEIIGNISLLAIGIVIVFSIFSMKKNIMGNLHGEKNMIMYMLLSISYISIFVILFALTKKIQIDEQNFYYLIVQVTFMFALCMASINMVGKKFKKIIKEYEIEKKGLTSEAEAQKYKLIYEGNVETLRFTHEIKNKFRVIRKLAISGDKQSIKKIVESIKNNWGEVYV